MERIIILDFAGTLFVPDALDEAQRIRNTVLERATPTAQEHAHSERLYSDNRALVRTLFGIADDAEIVWRDPDGEAYLLDGEEMQNILATGLFQLGMYKAAKERGMACFPQGLPEALARLKERGFSLAIASGVRTDIISGVLSITGFPVEIDYILGQPPTLGVTNQEQLEALSGELVAMVGDKRSDLEAADAMGIKKVFVTWGTPQGEEEQMADAVVSDPSRLDEAF